ncbi:MULTISPECIES: ribokinase [Lactobacillus]|uniref:Ribokinase n=1 Tax=Lactobacillus xujianguonis TaxID=2495899 RepID=A0A437SXX3_9LACO|nr:MULTISPECIES: ribokinase [Lactobacillus]RVU71667.1 ribokinase [Lactobacillus xujianguonis]RVU77682.1 ribokinase [Lactobacillus xujianguonis]
MTEITVLGSINVDNTYAIPRIPLPGETIHVDGISSAAGGKGANQAVAAQRSGAQVHFIGSVGDDRNGELMRQTMEKEGIDLTHVTINEMVETGSAKILLDEKGQNSILVYAGANGVVNPEQALVAEDVIAKSDYIIAQFETPIVTTIEAFKIAKKHGVVTILNPAPAQKISDELLALTDIITPNEIESSAITGLKVETEADMKQNAAYFTAKGVKATLITLGEKGVYYACGREEGFVKAYKVKAVDTTGAGDTFIGALSSVLKPDLSNLKAAIDYGQRASSITVQGKGAMPSIPTKAKITAVYGK